jgi:hypothetical protein
VPLPLVAVDKSAWWVAINWVGGSDSEYEKEEV